MAKYDWSLIYHSLRIYNGKYTSKNIPYRIGNTTTIIEDNEERFYDTWDDFHLIPAERPVIAIPKARVKMVSIPGRSTPIDLTEYATGHTTYGNRSGSISFFTDVDFVNKKGGWLAFDNQLRDLFHGHVNKISLRDDPSYFYAGELAVGQWQTGASYSSISISYNLYPYKKDMISSMDLWKWDDFDFVDGIIQYTNELEIDGTKIIKLYGSQERISPHISGSVGLTIQKKENSKWVNYGNVPTAAITSVKSIIPRFIIEEGENEIRLNGNGTVTIDYRRGLL